MFTFILICIGIALLIPAAVLGFMLLAGVFGEALFIVADICIGLAPFILIVLLVVWLFKKRN